MDTGIRPRKKARTSTSNKAEPDTTSNATPTCVIDQSAFPHIMDMIFDAAPPQSRWILSQTCRALRERFKVDIGGHVTITRARRYKDTPAHLELRPRFGVPAVPISNATGSQNAEHAAADGSSSVRSSSSAKKVVSIVLPTSFPGGCPTEEWCKNVFTSDELAWFTNRYITVVDIHDKSFPMTHQWTFSCLIRPKILRCPTALHVAHFKPDAIVYPITMVSSQTVTFAEFDVSLPQTSRLVFALRYKTIPVTGTVASYTWMRYGADAVIHVSATLDVADQNTVSSADKALNFKNFKSLIGSLCKWVRGDVTVVGLERVASSLFGVPTEGDNLAPAVIQELIESHPMWRCWYIPGLRKEFYSRLNVLSETEYLELHNMSPLMLAIERGARYH